MDFPGYDPSRHHRRSVRLRGFDYSSLGPYCVTLVTQCRLCLFGDVIDGSMHLNAAGQMVHEAWCGLQGERSYDELPAFVVMPNHLHGILVVKPNRAQPISGTTELAATIGRFKTITTKQYSDGVRRLGWVPFPGRLWQRSFYDQIIWNDRSWNSISAYIAANPRTWHRDPEHPR